jgi:hypothetical protein
MKVMALIYGNEAAWEALTPEEGEELGGRHRAFAKLAGSKIVTGAELAPTRAATTVRVRDGQTLVTDGPFAETKEVVGGFYLLDCSSLDEAAELTATLAEAATGAIELRPAHEEAAA